MDKLAQEVTMRRQFCLPLVLLAVVSLATSTNAAAQTCDCDISARKVTAYDALLALDEQEKQQALQLHLPFGVPTTPTGADNEILLIQAEYIINYDADLRVPTWAAYRLRKDDIDEPRERTECFRPDPRLENAADAAFCADYKEPIYDRGHMVPNADMTRSESAMINTYIFTNMTPQHDRLNQVIWQRLERYVRDWARVKGEIFIVTGAVFDRDGDEQRDPDSAAERMISNNSQARVAVPSHYYKIILHERPNGFIENLTILLPHTNESITGTAANTYLANHITNIDEIEALTGIDFLTGIASENPDKEAAIEANTADELWPRN